MGRIAGPQVRRVLRNVQAVLAIEMMSAAQDVRVLQAQAGPEGTAVAYDT